MFCMIMLVDVSGCNVDQAVMRAEFARVGEDLQMQVNVTRQEVFDAMHHI